MRQVTAALCFALVLALAGGPAGAVEAPTPIQRSWPHEGIFGTFDRAALQRGLQVYEQVCAGCHSLRLIAFRNLLDLGFSEDEVRAIAAGHAVTDGPDETGEMFERPGALADHYPGPYANEQQARLANSGALPPDLSLMTKARADGVNYLYSLLVGYEEPPPDITVPDGMHYNTYFSGHLIAMPEILFDGSVDYADGTPATVAQMAADVAQFLHWAAEPRLEERKQTGLKVMLFLIAFSGIFYAVKRKVWAELH